MKVLFAGDVNVELIPGGL